MRAQASTKVGLRRLRFVAPSVVIAITLGGSGAGAAASVGARHVRSGGLRGRHDRKIAFMLKQQTAFRYLNADIPFFTETAEAAGYEVIVQSAENDAATQVSQAENVLTQGVDAIVIQPVDFNVAGRIADMARDGRRAAGVVRRPDPQRASTMPSSGAIPRQAGAEAARETLAAVPTGNYVLIGGDPGQTGSTLMQEGYHEVLDPLVEAGDIDIVMDQFTPGWKTEPAQAVRRERADRQRQRRRTCSCRPTTG